MPSNSPFWWLFLVGLLLTGPAEAERPGEVVLAGPWEVSRQSTPNPPGAPDASSTTDATVELPKSWQELGVASDGVVLRSETRLPADWRRDLAPNGLGLLLSPGSWGVLEARAGGVALEPWGRRETATAEVLATVLTIPDHLVLDDVLTLELRARPGGLLPRRLEAGWGPVADAPRIGDLRVLEGRARRGRARAWLATRLEAVLAIFLATLGVFHLHLFGRRRRSREYLWFALVALDCTFVLAATTWLARAVDHRLWAMRVRDATALLLVVLMIELLWCALERPLARWQRFYQGSLLVVAGSVFVLPGAWLVASEPARWVWGAPGWVVMASLLLSAGFGREREERLFVVAASAVVVCAGVEWIAGALGVWPFFALSPWAFVAFALAMAVSLGGRFHRASSELEVLHHQLERMVEDRSSELLAANEQLRSEIAERKLAEEAMRMLERAVEQSIDGILVTDLDGTAQFANQAWARMHGHEVFELPGRPLELFHGPERMAQVEACLERVRDEGTFEGELVHCGRDGSEFPCWMSVTLLRDASAGPIGFVFIGRDISERRHAQTQQEQLESKVRQAKKLQSLGSLAGGIAHDYNNLLTGVLGNAMFLKRSFERHSSAHDKVRQIEIAAERAAELTNQLLAYAGEDPLMLELANPEEVIRELEGELRELLGPEIELALEGLEGLPTIEIDVRQLRQVLRALVRNAGEAVAGRGGRVVLRCSRFEAEREHFATTYLDEGQPAGPYLRLEVADEGVGIEPEIQRRVFDPFFSTRASARGLGLATVLGFVRAHQGAIRLDSRPGQGTTFSLWFPERSAAPSVHQPTPRARREIGRWRGTGKVLVVDDEALMREVSASILEEQGFEVLTAAEGSEAVAIYRRERPGIRLVLLDRTMPRVSGDRVLQEIRRMDEDATVVMMSGFRAKEALAGLEDQPPSGFIQKPFRPDELVRHLRQWLEGPVAAEPS